jgi:hypothetical protein
MKSTCSAGAPDKIWDKVICILSGQAGMQERNQFSSRPKTNQPPVHAPRTFPLSLRRAANLSLALFSYLIRGWPNLYSVTPEYCSIFVFSAKNCSKND